MATSEQVVVRARNESESGRVGPNSRRLLPGKRSKRFFDCVYNQPRDAYKKHAAELCPSIFHEGLLACLRELGTTFDHPAWIALSPPVELVIH